MNPIFPKDHPALCYARHDENDCIEPHIHVIPPAAVFVVDVRATPYLVEVPDSNGRVTNAAVQAVTDASSYDHDELDRVREVLSAAGFGDAQSFASPSKAVKALDSGYVEAQMRRVALIAAIDKAMAIDWRKESRDDMDALRIERLTAFAANREDAGSLHGASIQTQEGRNG